MAEEKEPKTAVELFISGQGRGLSANQGSRDVVVASEQQRAMAEVQAAIFIAIRNPRSETTAVAKMNDSVGRYSFAEKAYYSYPRGGKDISGPGINFAREFARVWGNIRYGSRILHDDELSRTVEGFAWDLETGTYNSGQSSFEKKAQRKDKNTGVTSWVAVDERDLRELTNKHASLLMRNAILQLLPRDLVDDLIIKAKSVVAKNIKGDDPRKAKVALINDFIKKGVIQSQLEGYIGKVMDKATPDDLATLKGVLTALSEGSKKEEFFGGAPTPAAKTGHTGSEGPAFDPDKVMNGGKK
jgi:hypothetical protein